MRTKILEGLFSVMLGWCAMGAVCGVVLRARPLWAATPQVTINISPDQEAVLTSHDVTAKGVPAYAQETFDRAVETLAAATKGKDRDDIGRLIDALPAGDPKIAAAKAALSK